VPKSAPIDRAKFECYPHFLAEDNRDDAFIMRRALLKAGSAIGSTPPANRNDAIAFLAGQGEYADREKFPLPVIALLDMNLPKKAALKCCNGYGADPTASSSPPIF